MGFETGENKGFEEYLPKNKKLRLL